MSNLPSAQQNSQLRHYAMSAHKSGFFPNYKSEEQIFMAMLFGFELGLGPISSLRHINAIKGNLSPSSELVFARVLQAYPNAPIHFVKLTEQECELHAARPGKKPILFRYTWDKAKKAGLTQIWDRESKSWKDNPTWKKFPTQMLKSRCVSEMATTLFPELTTGLMSVQLKEDQVSDPVVSEQAPPEPADEQPPATVPAPEPEEIEARQLRANVVDLMKELDLKPELVKSWCQESFNKQSLAELNTEDLFSLIAKINAYHQSESQQDKAPPQKQSKALDALERAKKGDPVVWNEPAKDITEPQRDDDDKPAPKKKVKNHATGKTVEVSP